MADRYRTPDGWTVDVVQLDAGDKLRIRHHGFYIADLLNVDDLARWIPAAELAQLERDTLIGAASAQHPRCRCPARAWAWYQADAHPSARHATVRCPSPLVRSARAGLADIEAAKLGYDLTRQEDWASARLAGNAAGPGRIPRRAGLTTALHQRSKLAGQCATNSTLGTRAGSGCTCSCPHLMPKRIKRTPIRPRNSASRLVDQPQMPRSLHELHNPGRLYTYCDHDRPVGHRR